MLADLAGHGFSEIAYEYGTRWTVKVIILAIHNAGEKETVHCVAGEKAAPPEKVEGPLRFRRFISAFDSHNEEEREPARAHLGSDFKSNFFNLQDCNKQIAQITAKFGAHFYQGT